MEGVIAKRCLRESSQREYNLNKYNINKQKLRSLYKKNMANNGKINSGENGKASKYIHKIKMKVWIQSINAMCVLITVICCNIMEISKINENLYVKKICYEYSKNYDINSLKQKSKQILNKTYKIVGGIIPNKIKYYSKTVLVKIKGYINVKNGKNTQRNNIYLEEKKNNINDGKGVSINEGQNEGVSIDLLSEKGDHDTEENQGIKGKLIKEGITFICPTVGTVSSEYGERNIIFLNVDPFHTGIDIANKEGTKIVASTDGMITKVSNNKYNGNFIEITNSNIVTKYAHLKNTSVRQGENIKQGTEIGKMGQTGYATGSHLHFEVVIDEIKINPREVLEF